MQKTCLYIIDPIAELSYSRDSSYVLGLAGQERSVQNYWCTGSDLFILDGVVSAKVQKFLFLPDSPYFENQSSKQVVCLEEFDYVLMRKDPPFTLEYYFVCQYLSLLRKARVINAPSALMQRSEKFYPYLFSDIFPSAFISAEILALLDFLSQHEAVVVKPINDRGGAGVLKLSLADKNSLSALEILTCHGEQAIIMQEYLPQIRAGDLRAIVMNGAYVGGVLRVPPQNDHRSNLHIGGTASVPVLTNRQRELLEILIPQLVKDGVYFAGVDLIGDFVTEINITSPTGLQAVKTMTGVDSAAIFWDGLLG